MAKIGLSRPKLYMISATYGSEAPVHLLYHLLHIHEESKPSETSGNKCSRPIDEKTLCYKYIYENVLGCKLDGLP